MFNLSENQIVAYASVVTGQCLEIFNEDEVALYELARMGLVMKKINDNGIQWKCTETGLIWWKCCLLNDDSIDVLKHYLIH